VRVDDLSMPVGAAIPVVEDLQFGTYAGRHFAAASSTGTLVYAPSTEGQAVLQWLARDGALTPIRGHDLGIESPRLSPAGDRVAFMGRRGDIWILDLNRNSVDLVVPRTSENNNWGPVWTPDGRSVTFGSRRGRGSWGLWEVTPGSEPIELLSRQYGLGTEAWSPDGRFLIFNELHPERGLDLWALPRDGEPWELVPVE